LLADQAAEASLLEKCPVCAECGLDVAGGGQLEVGTDARAESY
jgi:hypothetical protein